MRILHRSSLINTPFIPLFQQPFTLTSCRRFACMCHPKLCYGRLKNIDFGTKIEEHLLSCGQHGTKLFSE